MRLFAASLATETNTFSPIPTSRANFEASAYFPAGQHPDRATHTTAPLYVARQRAKREGFELIEGSCFWAEPSGTCAKADYEEMRDEILALLESLCAEGLTLIVVTHDSAVAKRAHRRLRLKNGRVNEV